MENLKKVISLHEASSISGYHQDYLSALIRKNEIKGQKMGGNWFTTEEEVKNYIFKQKIRHKNWIVKYFLFFIKRVNKSFIYALICLVLFSVGLYFYNKENYSEIQTQTQTVNTQNSLINKFGTKIEFKELKF